ncbi:MAG: hypothetical protein AB7G47_16875 [Mycolicibacterium sp.]|uniref:hypothetical protein n=1 Tax=Mycolicibacterium sp. TaxID=2320850 RepID=UPI003D0FDAA9
MRIAGLLVAATLTAACSQSVGGDAEPPESTRLTAPTSTAPSPTTAAGGRAPNQNSAIEDVIAWIEAGTPADASAYHEAYLDGVTTRLGDDVAFTAPAGAPNKTTQCMTDAAYNDGALSCLVDLDSPAPRPAGAEGMWKPGWVDFAGTTAQLGSLHGDPGPFVKGVGPPLPEGHSLTFGDTRCRSDTTGLFCVNYAHQSAIWISIAGVAPFGCLQPVPASSQAGRMFSC